MPTRAPHKVLDDRDVELQFGRNGKVFIQHRAAYIERGAGTVLGDSDQLEVS